MDSHYQEGPENIKTKVFYNVTSPNNVLNLMKTYQVPTMNHSLSIWWNVHQKR